MFKIKLGNGQKDESHYIYRWGMECLGQTVEFSLSHKEFADFKEKSRRLLSGPKKVKPYLELVRKKINEKRGGKKEQVTKIQTRKNETTEKEAVA